MRNLASAVVTSTSIDNVRASGVEMAYSTNIFELKESRRGIEPSQNDKLSEMITRWNLLEDRLKNILEKLDDSVSQKSDAVANTDDLAAVLEDVEREQKTLLSEISRLPASSLFDVKAKLEIWESVVMPKGSDPLAAQQSDLLVASVLSDLKNGIPSLS